LVLTHINNVKALIDIVLHSNADFVDTDAIKRERTLNRKLDDNGAANIARNRVFGLTVIKTCKYPLVYEEVKQ